MRTMALVVAAMLLVVGAAPASMDNWQIRCGLADNHYGLDYTRFGVAPTGTWDADVNDAWHPSVPHPESDVAFIYDDSYPDIYIEQGYGWPPPWGNHGSGAMPMYEYPGLLKDTRAPILNPDQPEFWVVKVYAPQTSAMVDLFWSINDEPGYEIPDNIYVRILANDDLELAGITGAFYLTGKGDGYHELRIQPFGYDDNAGAPIMHKWKIEAGLIPEPGTIVLMAGGLVGMAGLIRRRK